PKIESNSISPGFGLGLRPAPGFDQDLTQHPGFHSALNLARNSTPFTGFGCVRGLKLGLDSDTTPYPGILTRPGVGLGYYHIPDFTRTRLRILTRIRTRTWTRQ